MASRLECIDWPLLGSPRLRLAGRFEEPGRLDLVHNLSTMALHVYEYVGTIWIGDTKFDLKPGDATVTPAHRPSKYLIRRPGNHLCVHFEVLGPSSPSIPLPLHVRPTMGHQTVERMQQLIELHHASREEVADGPAHLAAQASLQAFLVWITALRHRTRSGEETLPPSTAEALQHLRSVLDARYREHFTAAQLSRIAGLSPAYLARMFRKQFGMTIQRYILHRRIDYARHLLLTRVSVKIVAYESGFPNPQYFCRQFRLVTGENPTALRKAITG